VTDDGIGVVTFDRAGPGPNLLDFVCLSKLDEALDEFEVRPHLKGIVFLSAKPGFIAGADLRCMAKPGQPADRFAAARLIRAGQQAFERIARLAAPTLAAIHGHCLGGGLELALACRYRAASPDAGTKLGLPETQLGILPAWGGSTRLPRLIGLANAIDLIVKGRTVDAASARRIGMVDEIVPRERMLELARRWFAAAPPLKHRRSWWWMNQALPAAMIRRLAMRRIGRRTLAHYPAVARAIDVITRACRGPVKAGLELEREAVLDLIQTPACQELLRLFFLREKAKKARAIGVPTSMAGASTGRPAAESIAVIGAGVMGTGIAQWAAARGCRVLLRDLDDVRLAEGVRRIKSLWDEGVRRHVMTPLEARAGFDRIVPVSEDVPLRGVDLVIEAAIETMEAKRGIFSRLDRLADPNTLLATNTSALPISRIADGLTHPERVVGLHFFNPVHRMSLVEVIVGRHTCPAAVDRALRFVQALGKTPVVVQDSPGFVVNRILMPYLAEAFRWWESGVPAREIDEAMLDFGMPMGPLRLVDEVGADIVRHVADTLATHLSHVTPVPALLDRLVESGCLGRKAGRGFYRYDSRGKEAGENPEAVAWQPPKSHVSSRAELSRSMADAMTSEARACLDEGICAAADDIDLAMVLGAGYAPFRGGPLAATPIPPVTAPSLPPSPASSGSAAQALPPPPSDALPKPSDPAPEVIDMSKMPDGQRAALEMTEAARDAQAAPGVMGGLFMGRFKPSEMLPWRARADHPEGERFLRKLEAFLKNEVDPDEIDRTGEIPDRVIEGLAKLGAFGIKIPKAYGGLGLSQSTYCRAAMLLGARCANLTALLSAHQSIGVPQPLLMFGTNEQKRKWLPRVAAGEISAFALTEEHAGSDPARMTTSAEPAADGEAFILNGEKLWCTNSVRAGVIVVMAKTPPKIVGGRSRDQITAFLVEMNAPGVEVTHRCRFMGLRALYNGVVRFRDVRVPRENVLWAEGRGLKLALTTLNTGRLTLPAACAGLTKRCLEIAREWAGSRVQWGQPIGAHAAIADKIASMAGDAFAMEAVTLHTAGIVDADHGADIRLEAAAGKLWATEACWRAVDETLQIRGGRGYETADSLRQRGEPAIAVERMLRDCRINRIFEGSSEILRLFIMREALDPHLRLAGPVFHSGHSWAARLRALARTAWFYAGWYPALWSPISAAIPAGTLPVAAKHLRRIGRLSRRLAKTLFHRMVWFGPKLERRQVLLGRFADIGCLLLVIAAAAARAQAERDEPGMEELFDVFATRAECEIDRLFDAIRHNADDASYRLARRLLEGKFRLEA
jgi:hypothetical protein